jgi:hypothetical protein
MGSGSRDLEACGTCRANLFLNKPSDLQCFTVKPVMSLPPSYKDKPVPEQILK